MNIEKRMRLRNKAVKLADILSKYKEDNKTHNKKLLEAEYELIKECQEWDTDKYIITEKETFISEMAELLYKANADGLLGVTEFTDAEKNKEILENMIKKF